jgi:hypothetical protein
MATAVASGRRDRIGGVLLESTEDVESARREVAECG